MNEIEKYADMINIEYKKSSIYPHMSIYERSAQFAPFSALTGYDECIEEEQRLVSRFILCTEEYKEKLDEILENIDYSKNYEIVYFVKDKFKEGGKYVSVSSKIKKVDYVYKKIILENKQEIDAKKILSITKL